VVPALLSARARARRPDAASKGALPPLVAPVVADLAVRRHESDCTSGDPSPEVFLSPGQALLPSQVQALFGEGNLHLAQHGFTASAGGFWLGGCPTVAIDARAAIRIEGELHVASTFTCCRTSCAAFICNGEAFCASHVESFTGFGTPFQDARRRTSSRQELRSASIEGPCKARGRRP
jgi:hypothetical protein